MYTSTPKRILIVDSDHRARGALAHALSEEGFDVVEAADAEQGLSVTFNLYPDAVISAEWMTGLTGSEMIVQMRSDPLMVSTPIILLADANNRSNLNARADAYIPEPFALSDLVNRLRRLLRRRALKSTGSWLKGDLRGFGLPDVLTMTQQNRLTGLLKVTAEEAGQKFQFLFDKGSLVWVTGPGVKG
ncbi:MAG: response regulator, partial [Myxococcota bacterium]